MLLVHPVSDSYQITDPAGNPLFEDQNCEIFFNFLAMDISDVKELFSSYYTLMLRIQQEALSVDGADAPLPCEHPDARKALSNLRMRLRSIHPFLPNNLYCFFIPQVITGHFVNSLIENELELDEHTFSSTLWMLISEGMQPMYRDDFPKYPISNRYNKEPLLRSFFQVYKKKLARKERTAPDFDYLENLQQRYRTCVYWTLDESSKRFKGMEAADRCRLYRTVFHPDDLGSDITIKMNFSWSKPETAAALRQYTEFGKGQRTVELFLDDATQMTWPEAEDSAQKTLNENKAQLHHLNEMAALLGSTDSDDAIIPDDAQSFFTKAQKAARKGKSPVPYITYQINSLEELFSVQIQGLLDTPRHVRRCKFCGCFFLTDRSNIDYCQRIIEGETQSCSVIGPGRRYLEASAGDPALSAYTRAYKRMFARLHRGTIEQDAFDSWRSLAKENLAKARSGDMTLADYIQWLEER